MHTAAGWDRALERRAFMDVLPSQIVQRRRKGSVGVAMSAPLPTNLSLVRGLMLDGQLIGHQLLDRRKVEAALTGSNVTLSPAAAEIIGEYRGVVAALDLGTTRMKRTRGPPLPCPLQLYAARTELAF